MTGDAAAVAKRTALFARRMCIDAADDASADAPNFLESSSLADGQPIGANGSTVAVGVRHAF